VHYVCTQIDQDLSVELDCFVVVLVPPVQDSASLKRLLLLANLQTLIDREVAALDVIDYFRSMLFMAENLDEVQEELHIFL